MRTILVSILIAVAMIGSSGCEKENDIVCPVIETYEVTSVAYQGHTVFNKEIMLKDDFISYISNTKWYWETYQDEIVGSPMYLEFRNINTMVRPMVVCEDGQWLIQCDVLYTWTGGIDQSLLCVEVR